MKKKLIFHLIFTVLGLCSIISLIVFFYTKFETAETLNEYKATTLEHIKGYISKFDENLLTIENEIVSNYSSEMKQLAMEIDSDGGPSNINDTDLLAAASKHNIDEIYLINKKGIIFKSTYENDLNLNLYNVSSEMIGFLGGVFGKGDSFTHRALVSKYNKLNKYIYYGPKDSDYIIEISVDVRKYTEFRYGKSYSDYLFNDMLKSFNDGNGFVTNIDVYDVTNNVNWSILQSNSRFNGDEDFIATIDPVKGLTLKQDGKIIFYYIIHDPQIPGIYFGRDLLLEAVYDFSRLQYFAGNILLFSLISILVIGAGIFFATSKFFTNRYVKRIIKINKNLNMLEQGTYPADLSFTEADEISEIAFNMNRMKVQIMDRELQLKNKLVELENATLALKESLERLEYDKLKNEFFANISHEFKTPLNILLSSLQLLDLYVKNGTITDDSDKLKHYMKGMQQNCYRLLRLINNLIDITKIDASFFHYEPHNHDIAALIEGIVLSTREYALSKVIKLNFHRPPGNLVTACDPDSIERIILNLLSNAIKFTPEGGNIDVTIFNKDKSIYITVKDNGIGIPSDKLQVIFERFRQVDKSFTRNAEGSGIGLSLVKALVEIHNGSISVCSEYGKGSEFTVVLPLEVLEEPEGYSSASLFHEPRIEKMNIEFSDIYT